jgi:hypothetical protein
MFLEPRGYGRFTTPGRVPVPDHKPRAAQGQNDKRMVELGKESRRKQYQSWLPKNSF